MVVESALGPDLQDGPDVEVVHGKAAPVSLMARPVERIASQPAGHRKEGSIRTLSRLAWQLPRVQAHGRAVQENRCG